MVSRDETLPMVQAALSKGNIRVVDFSRTTVAYLRSHSDPAVRQAAVQAFGPGEVHRPAVLEQMRPALRMTAVADRGRAIFQARCANCHRLNGEGFRVGPDLLAAKVAGKEALFAAIIEPHAGVHSNYQSLVVTPRDGVSSLGVISSETPTTFGLLQSGGANPVWPRDSILAVQPQTWSLMPEGIESGLNHQNLADLLAYILSAQR